MQERNQREQKKSYLTLLFISGMVYFFLAVVWRYVAPIVVAFFILTAIEPILSKWSRRFRIGRKPMAYVFLVITIVGATMGIWFGLIPYLKCCDFSWCDQIFKHPWIEKLISLLQQHGMGTLAQWSTDAVAILSKFLFYIGAYGLSIFLLAGIFSDVKQHMQQHPQGKLLLDITEDVMLYAKAYIKTQGKLFVIIALLCVPTLMLAGIQQGWLLGLLAAIFDFFPLFGTGIVLIPTAIWQILGQDYITAAVCVILFAVCAVVREILEPRFLGNAIKLPGIAVWLSVYAGTQLFGWSGVVKGPIGYLLICTIYRRVQKADAKKYTQNDTHTLDI